VLPEPPPQDVSTNSASAARAEIALDLTSCIKNHLGKPSVILPQRENAAAGR
jgi:hypothetical protein